MDRYYQVLLGEKRDMGLHPMEAKKLLAWKITARYHDSAAADAAARTGKPVSPRGTWPPRICRKWKSPPCLPA